MPPLVKLEVQEMKYQIMHYLQQHHADVEAEVERQIEHAIATYNFQARVTEAVHKAIDSTIQSYFGYGDGFAFVSNAVMETLNRLFATGEEKE